MDEELTSNTLISLFPGIFSGTYSRQANSLPYSVGFSDRATDQMHVIVAQGVHLPADSIMYNVSWALPFP